MDRMLMLKQMLDEKPDDSFIRYAIAKEYEKRGELEEALKSYLSLKKDDPQYVGLYYHLGKLYEELDHNDDALTVYMEGIKICKNQSDFHALSELNNAKTNLELLS